MQILSKIIGKFQCRTIIYMALLFLGINLLLRVTLQVSFYETLPLSGVTFPSILKGFVNDFAALVFVMIVPSLFILLPSNKFLNRPFGGRILMPLVIFIFSALLIFTAVSEYLFWDEFGSRFNFIAVDYLIYTTELMHNMVESYPLVPIFLGVATLALALTLALWRSLKKYLPQAQYHSSIDKSVLNLAHETAKEPKKLNIKSQIGSKINPLNYAGNKRGRFSALGTILTLALVIYLGFSPYTTKDNRFWSEYSKNGVYEIFSAYFNNQLDYRAFYKTIDSNKAFDLAQTELESTSDHVEFYNNSNMVHKVDGHNPEKRVNVIVVIMESMGSGWLGEYTPNLNELGNKGLSFSNMMSTGTRTVRGIEGIMLSTPPTPGNSIVRRSDNQALFNLGTMFHERGYSRDFIYGGIGYFDNMNAFFAGNGYNVTDKLDFKEENKTFSNAWGQCDEDLYSESLLIADQRFSEGKPFHQVLLTTSNHRPFSFPEGKIDMEQGSRRAAVKYSDFAIGKFIEQAKEKPWFDNTVFLFVGDHPSSIAGKTELPADAYGIVCVMYGPKYFEQEKIDTLCSQIDVAPTLLSSLNWNYTSQFFGTDAREIDKNKGRAWISTYQLLGFRTNDELVVLKPDGQADVTKIGQNKTLSSSNASRVNESSTGANKIAALPLNTSTLPLNDETIASIDETLVLPNTTTPASSDANIASIDDALLINSSTQELHNTATPALNNSAGADENSNSENDGASNSALINRTIASYQCAYDLFAGKLMKESAVAAVESVKERYIQKAEIKTEPDSKTDQKG